MIHETKAEREERLKRTFQRRGSMGRNLLSSQNDKNQNRQSVVRAKIRVRMHRGSLRRSMQTATEIHATKADLIHYLHTHAILNLDTEALKVEPYFMYPDTRIGWQNTYLVSCPLYGPLAYTDGPIN